MSTTGTLLYTPADGYTGADTVTVGVTDFYARSSSLVSIPVTVVGKPVAYGDDYSIESGKKLTLAAGNGLLSNDTLPGDTSNWRIQDGNPPAHGTLTTDDATGAITYTPEAGFVGDVTVKYILNGTGPYDGARSAPATVTFHVTPKTS